MHCWQINHGVCGSCVKRDWVWTIFEAACAASARHSAIWLLLMSRAPSHVTLTSSQEHRDMSDCNKGANDWKRTQWIDSWTSTTPKQPHQAHSFKTAATRVSHDTLILNETHLLPSRDADHVISSGKRSERNTVFHYFCIERVSFANLGGTTAQALWPWGQVSALCTGSWLSEWSLSMSLSQQGLPNPRTHRKHDARQWRLTLDVFRSTSSRADNLTTLASPWGDKDESFDNIFAQVLHVLGCNVRLKMSIPRGHGLRTVWSRPSFGVHLISRF